MSKRVSIRGKPRPTTADAWVDQKREAEDAPTQSVPMKRLTIDIPADLHRRFKAECARQGVRMADVVRELLEREYRQN